MLSQLGISVAAVALLAVSTSAPAVAAGGPISDQADAESDGKGMAVVAIDLSGNGYRPGSSSTGGSRGGSGRVSRSVHVACSWYSDGSYTGQRFYDAYHGNGRAHAFGVLGLTLPSDEEIAAHREDDGHWYWVAQYSHKGTFSSEDMARCDAKLQASNGSGYIWVPAGQDPPTPQGAAVPAEILAEAAYDNMTAPDPVVDRNPAAESLVRFPTWFWVRDDPGDDADGFVDLEVTATAGDNSATVTATPDVFTVRIPGQPARSCDAPRSHTAWRSGASQDAACTVLPLRSSAAQPGRVYTVTARTAYTVAWTGVEGGVAVPGATLLPVTAQSTFPLPVAEMQALVRSDPH